jgi:galactose-1-phosphate uridylyltransferase
MAARRRRLPRRELDRLTRHTTVEAAGYAGLVATVEGDEDIARHRPDDTVLVDPRRELPVLCSEARLDRPHDTGESRDRPCPVCSGALTPVIDRAPLGGSRGETFVTPNLFPIVVPRPGRASRASAAGLHFVQWNSTRHDLDLDTMRPTEVEVVLARLAHFEEVLLHDSDAHSRMPTGGRHRGRRLAGWLGLIKNVGAPVGGSLVHGHQQLAHLAIEPRSVARDRRFARRHGRTIDRMLASETPRSLEVARFDGGVRLVVPPYAHRPLDAVILLGRGECSFLHELRPRERHGLAQALGASCRALVRAMPRLGREVSYNLVFHLHPAAGLHVEVLPFTQEVGGYERLGVYLSHATPATSAMLWRESLD